MRENMKSWQSASRVVSVMVAVAGVLGACTVESPHQTSTPEFDEVEKVTPDMTAYAAGPPIMVGYTGLPGNPTDWVAIAPQDSPDTTITVWVYTNGATSGSASFNTVASGT